VVDGVEEDGTWSRVIVLAEGPALVSGHQHGDGVTFEAAPANTDDHRTLAALVTRIFSLDVEVAPFFRRLRREPGLAEVVRRCAGLRPQRFASLFETLANGLACQQLSLDSGLMRLGRLDVFPAGDVGAARTLGRILGRTIAPARAGRIAARFSPFRGMLYFCILGWVLSSTSS